MTFALEITSEKTLRKYVKDKDMLIKIEREWNRQETDRANENNLFSGVKETIQELYKKNIRLGVVTSETKKEYENEVTRFWLNKYFSIIVTASDTKRHKPNPDPINFAISKLNAISANVLYIGDTKYDMLTARAAHVNFAVAGWGAHDKISNADYYLNSPEEILKFVK